MMRYEIFCHDPGPTMNYARLKLIPPAWEFYLLKLLE